MMCDLSRHPGRKMARTELLTLCHHLLIVDPARCKTHHPTTCQPASWLLNQPCPDLMQSDETNLGHRTQHAAVFPGPTNWN